MFGIPLLHSNRPWRNEWNMIENIGNYMSQYLKTCPIPTIYPTYLELFEPYTDDKCWDDICHIYFSSFRDYKDSETQ